MFMNELIKRYILRSLILSRRWGGKHTEIKNLIKGIPINLINTKAGKRELRNAIKELINEGFLLAKKSTNEIHVSLNPRKKEEILKFVTED